MLSWLKATYLRYHHRWVRRGTDHPIQHARRMLGLITERTEATRLLLDLGAGFEPFQFGDLWKGKRVAIEIKPGRGVDILADGHHLPFQEKIADVVLLMETLEHVPAPLLLLLECARVLRPGGYLCLTTPQYCILHDHPGDFYRYTHEGLRYLCKEAGLHIQDIRPTGGPFLVVFHAIEWNLPPKTRLVFVALAYRLFDWLDGWVCGHGSRAGIRDAVGWAVLATKV